MCLLICFQASVNGLMVGVINGITFVSPPVPGLTQNDSEVAYCNEHIKPNSCQGLDICHCSHLIELEPCEVYDFVIQDYKGKKIYEQLFDT